MHLVYTQRVQTIVLFRLRDTVYKDPHAHTEILSPQTDVGGPIFGLKLIDYSEPLPRIDRGCRRTYRMTIFKGTGGVEERILHRVYLCNRQERPHTIERTGQYLHNIARTIEGINRYIPPCAKDLESTIRADAPIILEDDPHVDMAVLFVLFCSYARFCGALSASPTKKIYDRDWESLVLADNLTHAGPSVVNLMFMNMEGIADQYVSGREWDHVDFDLYIRLCLWINNQVGPQKVVDAFKQFARAMEVCVLGKELMDTKGLGGDPDPDVLEWLKSDLDLYISEMDSALAALTENMEVDTSYSPGQYGVTLDDENILADDDWTQLLKASSDAQESLQDPVKVGLPP